MPIKFEEMTVEQVYVRTGREGASSEASRDTPTVPGRNCTTK